MKRPNSRLLLTGGLAGVTATLLVLGANAQPSFSAVLYAASALPILIAGLGWGIMAAIVAVVTAFVLGAVAVSPSFALIMTLVTLAPAGWLSHLANLGRPASELGGPDNLVAWYPLSDILLQLCALVTVAVIAVGVMIGYGPDLTDRMVEALITALKQQEPTFVPDPAATVQTKSLVVLLLPAMQAALWVVMLFAAYYLATRIVTASGRNHRPREDMPSALRMNRNAIFAFLAGLVACFLGGIPALIGATVLGAFGAGFLVAGFASLHFRTRGKEWRMPALILCYLAATMVLPALFILVLGLSDTRKAIALTPHKDANASDNPNTKL
ncbi:DUF2232 domain-containing protein [Rhizobium sp. RAF56]|uniref:DUF2232 domain-containing protein n=1 Tax=Rhizobium sp. RAF56 TaxID=3233062 RepID=UPI003F95BAB9